MIKRFGLIGFPLSHTFSPDYFAKKFAHEGLKHQYAAYEIDDISKLDEVLADDVSGLNVTIPYKEKIIPFLDTIDEGSKAVGAVNTIKIKDGKLHGFNTDVYGFRNSLVKLQLPFSIEESKSIILGSGCAAKAVNYVLDQLGSGCTLVSRTLKTGADITYEELQGKDLAEFNIIVNTTPLGTFPQVNAMAPISYNQIYSDHLVYDLIYNPDKSLLLERAEARNAVIKNGAEMLILQAEKSWEIWNNEL